MNQNVTIDYFKDAIESRLAHIYVTRRTAEILGFDAKELDRFIAERSRTFYESTERMNPIELSTAIQKLTKLSEENIKSMLK